MARYKYPPIKAIGVRLSGGTPPELMTAQERHEYGTKLSMIAAVAIGGKPKTISEPSIAPHSKQPTPAV